MLETHVYDLSFVMPKRRPATAPEIVFSTNRKYLTELRERLEHLAKKHESYAKEYIGRKGTAFSLPVPDLIDNAEFGYGRCGYMTLEDKIVQLRLRLGPGTRAYQCALTIHLLSCALGSPFENRRPSNRQQIVRLNTVAEHDLHGHSVGGYLAESFIRWLEIYARDKIEKRGLFPATPMHPEVLDAMRTTWHAISSVGEKKRSSDISGWIQPSGCFTLICFGNACDLSVYPDQMTGEGCRMVELGSHNLDDAPQQLTLLAGLATLLQLVASE